MLEPTGDPVIPPLFQVLLERVTRGDVLGWSRILPAKETQMAKALGQFTIEPSEDGFLLHIEDEDGTELELTATPEQLDLIAEAIDEHLETDVDGLDEADG